MAHTIQSPSFYARLRLALRLLGDADAAARALAALDGTTTTGSAMEAARTPATHQTVDTQAAKTASKGGAGLPATGTATGTEAGAIAGHPAATTTGGSGVASVEPPERAHASGLMVLGLLQREGRLVDFLQEDVAAHSDADIGAAARVVHAGCRKALAQYVTLEAALPGAEGEAVTLPSGYDVQRVQITGNVSGQPPFRGTLRHHGWVAAEVRLPTLSKAIDARVIAPAEVEL